MNENMSIEMKRLDDLMVENNRLGMKRLEIILNKIEHDIHLWNMEGMKRASGYSANLEVGFA
jgi:hypothetical protein